MKYFTQPPVPDYTHMDLPPFMVGRYSDLTPVFDTKYMLELSHWAELEYNDNVAFHSGTGNRKSLAILRSVKPYVAQAYIVAYTKEFSQIVKYMDNKTWWSYPDTLRKFLSLCYKIYSESEKN
jgi:hypothetical protein